MQTLINYSVVDKVKEINLPAASSIPPPPPTTLTHTAFALLLQSF